jgi:DNA-directed RNA polymerase specialized sigma24 family protein
VEILIRRLIRIVVGPPQELLRPAMAPAKLTKKTSTGRTGDVDDGTDDEDPKHAAAKGQALRAAARRQAHKLRAETTDGPHKAQQDHDGKTGRDGPNEDIALALEELAKLYRDAVHKNKFSRESYQKVANIVRSKSLLSRS